MIVDRISFIHSRMIYEGVEEENWYCEYDSERAAKFQNRLYAASENRKAP